MRISDWSSDVCSSDLRLGEGPYTLGNQFSLCDLYLFVYVLWSRRPMLDGKLSTLSHLDAFGARLSARPAVRAALAQEGLVWPATPRRSEEHTSELQSLMRIPYPVFCLEQESEKR